MRGSRGCNFTLSGQPSVRFVEPRWLKRGSLAGQSWFLLFRLVLAVYWTGWVVADILRSAVLPKDKLGFKWLIYFTHLSALALSAYFVMAFLICVYWTFYLMRYTSERHEASFYERESKTMPLLYKLTWILHEIAGTVEAITVLLYWILVYTGGHVTIFNIHMHGIGLGLYILNSVVSSTPTHLSHVYFPFIFYTLYVAFTVVFWKLRWTNTDGERWIYKELNYSKSPVKSMIYVLAVGLVVLPVIHLLFCLWGWMWTEIATLTSGYDGTDSASASTTPKYILPKHQQQGEGQNQIAPEKPNK